MLAALKSAYFYTTQTAMASEIASQPQRKFQMDRHLYLAAPIYLELIYVINPWMTNSRFFSKSKALEQHIQLIETYTKILGSEDHITVVKPATNLTELCFFGDSQFSIGNKTLFGRLACPERFKETAYAMTALKQLGFQGERVPEGVFFEGSGETMLWNDKIIIGYGRRNSKSVVPIVEKYFNKEVIALELIDPLFYHLDIALFPISKDLIAIYEEAFTTEGLRLLRSLDCEILKVNKQDVQDFALNSIALGQDIVVHWKAKNFISELEKRGFTVHPIDVSEFMKFGGGLKCLTFQHYLERQNN